MDVVILCGGKGTRSYPYTEYFPKPMMPIAGTPILLHIMKLYASQGFTSFVLAGGHRIEVLEDYFRDRNHGWRVRVLDTGSDSDTGERIRRCQEHVGETFFATYGDGIGDIDLNELLRFHKSSGLLATLTTVPLRSQYGTVHMDEQGHVHEFREKPVLKEHSINAGFFVFESKVFDVWEGQNLENEVFPALVKRGQVQAHRHSGFWKSMDTSKDQQELEQIYLERNSRWVLPAESEASVAGS